MIKLIFFLLLSFPLFLRAEIILDGSLGTVGKFSGTNITLDVNVGKQQGNTLFHSFEQFNIGADETVTFLAPTEITYIINRVTGEQPSLIEGRLRSPSTASFYFLNPAGVTFGADARLDVNGSFYVSTANTLRFEDNTQLKIDSTPPLLTSAPPVAFGFLNHVPANISLIGRGIFLRSVNTQLALLGGNLVIGDNQQELDTGLYATKHIDVLSIHQGEALKIANGFELSKNSVLGKIIINDSTIGLRDYSKKVGNIDIQGKQITIQDSMITRQSQYGDAEKVNIRAEELNLINSSIHNESVESGTAGDINIHSNKIFMQSGYISTRKFYGTGSASSIYLTANTIELTDSAAITADNIAGTKAGNISIDAIQLKMDKQSIISNSNLVLGDAGNISIHAQQLQLSNAFIFGFATKLGEASNIEINANDILLDNETKIASSIITNQLAKAGNIKINANNKIDILNSSIVSYSIVPQNTLLEKEIYGNIDITARSFFLKNSILSTYSENALGGNIQFTLKDVFYIENTILQAEAESGVGNGGNININTPSVIVLNGLKATAAADIGNGGNITIDAIKRINSRQNPSFLTATSRVGESGQIIINAPVEDLSTLVARFPMAFQSDPFERCMSRSLEKAGSSLSVKFSFLYRPPTDFDSFVNL